MEAIAQLAKDVVTFWRKWEIRGLVQISLILQIILILLGSRRKRNSRIVIRLFVWSAYLLADIIATFSLGILARSQGDSQDEHDNLIQSFWAPFLLLHLGGPDTITAFAIEDNELWVRHLLSLVIQVVVALYVFAVAWASSAGPLTFIAIPVFIAGLIKYGERTWVLWYSSSKHIKDVLFSKPPRIRLDTKEIMVVPRVHYIPKISYLRQAHYLYNMSLYLFQDLILSFSELKDSYSIISSQTSEEAFKLVEVELGLIHDRLFTKAPLVYSRRGIFLRSITFISTLIALICFSTTVDKDDYSAPNIATTYLLLAGALVLEVYALLYLLFSDWTAIWLTKYGEPTDAISHAIVCLHHFCLHHLTHGSRWSGTVSQFNLINSSLRIKTNKCFKLLGIDELMKYMCVNRKPVEPQMKDLIFNKLLEKGNEVLGHLNDYKLRNQLVDQKGEGVLEKMKFLEELKWCTTALEFNHSLLIWHVATDLCYYQDFERIPQSEIGKRLSDYMFYLLVIQPNLLPRGIGDMGSRYQHACDEVRTFVKKEKTPSENVEAGKKPAPSSGNGDVESGKSGSVDKKSISTRENGNVESGPEKQACRELFGMDYATIEDKIATPIDTTPTIPGAFGSSKYLLVHGCMLAKQLQSRDLEKRWSVINEVWIEMLAFAASHCEWKEHAQGLRNGGELLTHVCVLMAHLGLSQRYREILVS